MKHIKNTIKAIGIICFMAISVFLLAFTCFGAQIAEIIMEGTYYSLTISIVWGIIYLLCINKVRVWLSFLDKYMTGNLD